jgi:murein DD-endopeptidase MepM/ murein hydrolase activator NlpD
MPAGAQTADQDQRAAERAASEIEAARSRANAAAAELDRAETAFAEVEDDLERVTAAIAASQQRLGEVQASLRDVALRRYTRGDLSALPISVSNDDVTAQVRADAMLRFFTLGTNDAIDQFQQVGEDLDTQNRQLEEAKKQAERVQAGLEAARRDLDARIVQLQEAERERANDAAVRRVLEARRAAELQAEQAKAAAEAKVAAERSAASRPAASSSGGGAAGAPRASARPAPAPAPAPARTSGMVCPVAGPAAYADTWGAARSGGRSHEGVDMLGARGTPIVAVVSGTAQPKNNSLGGNAVWLTGSNGYRYYYAHLDSFGASGAVSAGTVIGYMGDTGNARGTVHLHFEVHPGGGRAVNPTPYVRAVC